MALLMPYGSLLQLQDPHDDDGTVQSMQTKLVLRKETTIQVWLREDDIIVCRCLMYVVVCCYSSYLPREGILDAVCI
eukprot:scaffold13320_cov215-Alexandrium_tamarense.AAC.17